LTSFLEELCVQVEHLSPGSLCSILLVDPDGDRFRVGPALIFPGPYNAVLEGLEIDPNYGPCSLAVESRSAIIAADPPRDPGWSSSPWPEVILGYGLASCWSAPIFSSRVTCLVNSPSTSASRWDRGRGSGTDRPVHESC
jgi:GAF domain-containing protein